MNSLYSNMFIVRLVFLDDVMSPRVVVILLTVLGLEVLLRVCANVTGTDKRCTSGLAAESTIVVLQMAQVVMTKIYYLRQTEQVQGATGTAAQQSVEITATAQVAVHTQAVAYRIPKRLNFDHFPHLTNYSATFCEQKDAAFCFSFVRINHLRISDNHRRLDQATGFCLVPQPVKRGNERSLFHVLRSLSI